MADKEDSQLGWGDEKTAPVVIQTPGGGGRSLALVLGITVLVAMALAGFFAFQWTQSSTKLEALRTEFGDKEKTLETRLTELQALRSAETAYATALQAENQFIREGKSPPPTTVSPMQDWIDRMRAENEQRRFCVANPRHSRCRGPIPVTTPPPGMVVFGREEE